MISRAEPSCAAFGFRVYRKVCHRLIKRTVAELLLFAPRTYCARAGLPEQVDHQPVDGHQRPFSETSAAPASCARTCSTPVIDEEILSACVPFGAVPEVMNELERISREFLVPVTGT
jgi:hypothetical protein